MKILPEADVSAVECAAEALRTGGVVLIPTDTLYGLGADALSDEAVRRVAAIKGRDTGKPIHALVADIEMAARYGQVSDQVRCMIERLPNGKMTFVVNKRKEFTTGIFRDRETFGFRIPDHPFCSSFIRKFDGAVTATSANVAGMEPERSLVDILAQLGKAVEHIALAVDGGAASGRAASTVVDLSSGKPRILREGAISAADVHNAWAACARC